jgi:hypothetical protein
MIQGQIKQHLRTLTMEMANHPLKIPEFRHVVQTNLMRLSLSIPSTHSRTSFKAAGCGGGSRDSVDVLMSSGRFSSRWDEASKNVRLARVQRSKGECCLPPSFSDAATQASYLEVYSRSHIMKCLWVGWLEARNAAEGIRMMRTDSLDCVPRTKYTLQNP